MFNVALEFGVLMKVDKKARHAQKPQYPQRKYFRQRGMPIDASLITRIKARLRRYASARR